MDTKAPVASQEALRPPLSTYSAHFGLSRLPFENVPDPTFFFNQGEYQRVLRRITDALAAGRGLMVVAGPIGSGKTTLSQRLMREVPADTVHLWLAEPPGTDREILQLLLQRLGYPLDWGSRVLALGALRDRLLEVHARGGRCLLVIDESHKITDEGLETIRLLNNLEEGASKLIQILLFGQEELYEMLTRTGREAFRQRIANFEILGCMTQPQVRDYVHHRLRVAGGNPALIPDPLIEAIAEATGGTPRQTNSLCDRAMLYAFENRKTAVDARDLLLAAEDLSLYGKAFPFLVGQCQFETATPTPSEPASPLPEFAPAHVGDDDSSDAMAAPRRSLAGPLALLVAGVVALAASLFFYWSRATAIDGGGWLTRLANDIFGP